VNTVTASLNTIMGKMTEMSQRKKTPSMYPRLATPALLPQGTISKAHN